MCQELCPTFQLGWNIPCQPGDELSSSKSTVTPTFPDYFLIHSSSSGALRSRCQEGIRYAEDLFGETVLKDKAEREQEAVGRASEQTLGLTPVKGDERKERASRRRRLLL